MKPPKRLRNPPKKRISTNNFDVKKTFKTTPRRNGQTTAVPHGENVPMASDMEASQNDTRPTYRPLYDVSRLSTPSDTWSVNVNCSTRITTAVKLSSNSGPGDAGCSTRTTIAGKLSSNTGPRDAGC